MTTELNGLLMTDRAAVHDHLQDALNLPDYYGRNLDALFDLLTERSEPCSIILHHVDEMTNTLGSYAASLLKTLRDATDRNPTLTVTIL